MTKIEWTHPPGYAAGKSWNPTTGCSHVSAGCDNCYAARTASRNRCEAHVGLTVKGKGGPLDGRPIFNGTVKLHEDRLDQPLRVKQPTVWFVDSMSDLFHKAIYDDFIDAVLGIVSLCPQHRFIVLTKRAAEMRDYMTAEHRIDAIDSWNSHYAIEYSDPHCRLSTDLRASAPIVHEVWPLPNLILGVSCEDQATADERIPPLLETPAATRCVSCEPLLGPIDHRLIVNNSGNVLDWIISGGESGPKARPSHPDWHRTLRDQCAAAGVPFFFKQWGEWAPGACAEHPQTRKETVATWDVGRWFFADITPAESESMHVDQEPDVYRFGKKRAGRLLDGREHNGFPPALLDRAEVDS